MFATWTRADLTARLHGRGATGAHGAHGARRQVPTVRGATGACSASLSGERKIPRSVSKSIAVSSELPYLESAMKKIAVLVSLVLLSVRVPAQSPPLALLLRQPTVSRTHIAFAYAGDIWVVAREGGEARRLTAGQGSASHPVFSPDGSTIAYTAK